MSTTETTGGQKISQGAIRAAEIITGGKMGQAKRYPTDYGSKTVEGVAAIIDQHTAATELREALQSLVFDLAEAHADEIEHDHYGDISCSYCEDLNAARAAIAKATDNACVVGVVAELGQDANA